MLELVEMEIREILTKYEYDGDNAHIIKGSALAASNDVDPEIGEKSVVKLLEIMDTAIPLPERPINLPFMMSIDSTFTIPGRGTVVAGTIE
jgi:elongation factor Tu